MSALRQECSEGTENWQRDEPRQVEDHRHVSDPQHARLYGEFLKDHEQAGRCDQVGHRGKPLSAVSDIFSLGVVCYETLTRRRLFERATEESVVNAILRF